MCYNPNEVIHMGMEILTDNSAVLEDIAARKAVIETSRKLSELETALAVEREERRRDRRNSTIYNVLSISIAFASLIVAIIALVH